VLEILAITFPIFALVALGYGSVRFGAFRPEDMRVLGLFVMNIALPALLFTAVAERSLTETLRPAYMAAFLAGGLATIAITWVWFTATGTGPARKAIAVMGSTCPNSGYVGYPLMLLLMPEHAGLILAMNLVVENFVLIPLTLLLLETSRLTEMRGGVWPRLKAMLWGVLRRPMVLGLLAGIAVSLIGLPLPSGVTRLLDLLASSTGAIALFVIGGSLVGLPIRGNRALAAQIVAGKLLLHPAMVALALALLPLAGLALTDPDLRLAVVLSAAMPMFGIYALFAQDYGHEGIASLALLGATAGAFFTLTLLLAVLR
jgi:predicted permease